MINTFVLLVNLYSDIQFWISSLPESDFQQYEIRSDVI